MRKKYLLGAVATAMLFSSSALAAEEKVLNVYNWSDYIAEGTLKNSKMRPALKSIMMCLIQMRF